MADSFSLGEGYIEFRIKQDKLNQDTESLVRAIEAVKKRLEGQTTVAVDQQLAETAAPAQAQAAAEQTRQVADAAADAGDELKDMGKRGTDAFEGIVGKAIRAIAIMGTVELAVGAINTVTELLAGDFEDAAEAVKKLPAGIGPAATQIEALLGVMSGITQEIERIESTTRAMEAAMEFQRLTAQKILDLEKERLATLEAIRNKQQLLAAKPEDRDELKSEQDRLRQEREAAERVERARRAVESPSLAMDKEQKAALDAVIAEGDKTRKRIAELRARETTVPVPFTDKQVRFSPDLLELEALLVTQRGISNQLQQMDRQNSLNAKKELETALAVQRELLMLHFDERQKMGEEDTAEARAQADERMEIARREAEDRVREAEREFNERKRREQQYTAWLEQHARKRGQQQSEIMNQLLKEAGIAGRINDLQLRIDGRGLQADLEEIDRGLNRALSEAKSDAERDLLRKEAQLKREQAIGNAQDQLDGAASPIEPTISSLESAIDNLQDAALGRVQDEQVELLKQQIEAARRQEQAIGKVEQAVREQKPPAAVGE